jgi:hypothetical protein
MFLVIKIKHLLFQYENLHLPNKNQKINQL